MANDFYNYTTPVVAGTTIRADKYNSDHQAIESSFDMVENAFASTVTLPSTFTGNHVIPEQTANNSFIYINPTGDMALYPIQTFLDQFAQVEEQYQLTVEARNLAEDYRDEAQGHANTSLGHANTALGYSNLASTHKDSASGFADDALGYANTALGHANTASGFADNASTSATLSSEYANKPEDIYVTGTLDYSAFHWAKKAETYANDTLATVEGNFVPTSRTVNNKALSANVTLSATDIGSTDGNVQLDINALQAFQASTGPAATYNVGAGSGLDADTVDGIEGADIARTDVIRKSLLDSPLCRLFTPNKLVDTLAGSLTWARASNATYVDRYGVVKTAAIDTPREESEGWLIEGASTNLNTNSQEFSGYNLTGASLASNGGAVAPDAVDISDKLIEDTSNGVHRIFKSVTVTSGVEVTVSMFVRREGRNFVQLLGALSGGTAVGGDATFDLVDGTVTDGTDSTITALGNFWFRITRKYTTTSTSLTVQLRLYDGAAIYTGDGSSGVSVWGWQVEELPFASSYIPTTAAPATRAADEIEIEQLNNVISSAESAWSIFFRGNRFGVRVMQITEGATDNSSTTDYSLFYGISDDVFVRDCSSSGVGLSSTGGFVENSWFSYTSAIYGASKTIYGAGGTSAATITPTTSINESSTMRIGSAKNGNYPVYGHIQDFRIYDFELNADEVALLSGVK